MISYKYGVRAFALRPEVVIIHQTVKKTGSKTYVIDRSPDGKQRKKHIQIKNDKAIADAVRYALVGKL